VEDLTNETESLASISVPINTAVEKGEGLVSRTTSLTKMPLTPEASTIVSQLHVWCCFVPAAYTAFQPSAVVFDIGGPKFPLG
jgi:hypothetical protein